jgi:hypothetical protein
MAYDGGTAAEFIAFSREKLVKQYWPRMRQTVALLSDDQIWWRPNESANSVGNLLLHVNGNVRQWLLAPFSGLADARDRPAEFSARGGVSGSALLERLGATIVDASSALSRLKESDLTATFQIQGYTVSGLAAVYQVVEHFGMHYGQILYIAKMLRGEDLGFYRELDLTGRVNSSATSKP